MSCDKCFYCECLLKPRDGGSDDEVEHRCGVRPHELAYDWKNLYLSCSGCNGAKKSLEEIPIEDTLDPCDDAIDPIDHLDVYVEYARPYGGSLKGEYTIKKLGLNAQTELLLARQRCLSQFWKARGDRIAAAALRGPVSADEKIAIERALAEEFAQPHMPFSWMFRAMLRRSGALSR